MSLPRAILGQTSSNQAIFQFEAQKSEGKKTNKQTTNFFFELMKQILRVIFILSHTVVI